MTADGADAATAPVVVILPWVIAACCLAGCNAETLEFAGWTMPVPEGTPVMGYAAVPNGERTAEIGMTEDLIIGGDSADPQALFHPRGYTENAIAVDGDRVVFVLDSGNSRVLAFDAGSGSYLFSLGDGGQGPGEFQRASRIAIAGGRLAVIDSGAPKLSWWSLGGDHGEDTTVPSARLARGLAGLPDGTALLRFREGQRDESRIVLARVDAQGAELTRYLEAPGPRIDVAEIGGNFLTLSHSGPEPTLAVAGEDRIYITAASEYQVLAMEPDGTAKWALRVAMAREPYAQELIDGLVESMQERFPGVTADMFNWPEQHPALAALRVDGHGHLYVFPWVSSEYLEREGRRPVDVFAADGERLLAGFIRTQWDTAHGDHVFNYVQEEEDGEWRVVRYRLVENFR